MLLARGVEGFITTDTSVKEKLPRPTVAVAGHELVEGVTNITGPPAWQPRMALSHLSNLGHKDIALFKGPILIRIPRNGGKPPAISQNR